MDYFAILVFANNIYLTVIFPITAYEQAAMNRKLLKDVSASAIQVTLNQLLGFAVFLITSFYLPKEIYGELNWSIAVLTFITTVLSLRLEQVVVKKAAAAQNPSPILTLFMLHVLLTGIGFYLLLLLLSYVFPVFFTAHNLLLMLGISQLLSFFSSPFRQVANGRERFDYLAIMSSVANLVRTIGLIVMIAVYDINIEWVLLLFILSSFIEFVISWLIVTRLMRIPFSSRVGVKDYRNLLKESIHQVGAAVLMAGITRMDWIFLGIFSTASVTAEYSFAYRVYELSPFPLLIIAPVLLSRFSKYFSSHNEESLLQKARELRALVRIEMIAATLVPLILNIIWTPVVDSLTGNKYGAVNQWTFFILSVCIPFQYITNLLWSAHFAQHRLKLIFRITLITFCIILLGDIIFIPLYNAKGAALVYLVAIITEYFNYMRSSRLSQIRDTWQSLLVCLFSAVASGFLACYIFDAAAWRLAVAIPLFFLILLATDQWKINDIRYVIQLLRQKGPVQRNNSSIPI